MTAKPKLNRIHETMTRVKFRAGDAGLWRLRSYTVRVWRSAEADEFGPDRKVDEAISAAQKSFGADDSNAVRVKKICDAVEKLGRIEAIEVLDERGNGSIVYPDWK
jgi:hypothetical protein